MARVEPMAPVNIRADKAYLKALKAVAYSRGQFIGDLVRDAVDVRGAVAHQAEQADIHGVEHPAQARSDEQAVA